MKPLGLHAQAIIVSTFLVAVPFAGLRLVDLQYASLLDLQRHALSQKAMLVAASLAASSLDLETQPEDALVAHTLDNWIDVDGRVDDWGEIGARTRDLDAFSIVVGRSNTDLFLFMRVTDDSVVYRETLNPSVHRNDYVQLATLDPEGNHQRYTLAGVQPGPVDAAVVTTATTGSRAVRTETLIEAYWLATEQGFNIEVRIPIELITSRFSIAVTDVDDPVTRQRLGTSGNGSTTDPDQLGSLFLPSAAMLDVLRPFDTGATYLVLKDPLGRPLAELGERGSGIFAGYVTVEPSISVRSYLTAEAPIIRGDDTIAFVVATESTGGLERLRRDASQRVWQAAALIMVIGVLTLLLYATFIRHRIRRVDANLDRVIDRQGKVREEMQPLRMRDELGDLSRNIAQVTNRLREYHRYLEDMSKRLAHELRTPVTVIRSSLENMTLTDDPSVYVERAQEGVARLSAILTNMTEATRLEESLRSETPAYFDLVEVISGCTGGYRVAYPDTTFELSIEGAFGKLQGLPDVIAQMLDKLVGNAVGFATPGTPVRIRLQQDGEDAVLRVSNEGPPLPDNIDDKLFDSMLSARTDKDDEPHLGLGLFIARLVAEYHGGSIEAKNRDDASGVIVSVRLPLFRVLPERNAS